MQSTCRRRAGTRSKWSRVMNDAAHRWAGAAHTVEVSMERFVIAAFRPKPGMADALLTVVEKHWHILESQGLVSSRPRYAMQASDGTIVEVFEWASAEAISRAHENQAVLALWAEFESACEYVPLASLAEATHPFSEFRPLAI